MKEFYEKPARSKLTRRMPVAIRIDGKAFHTFTKGFERPFDKVFMESMQKTAKYMCENIQGAKLAYVQSDEITVVLVDYDTLETDCWFNYRTDKMCSIAASMATMAFNKFFANNVDVLEMTNEAAPYYNALEKGAMFDARCFNIPKEEVANLIYWRQLDATRNSIQMVGQANFSHSELQNKSCNMIQDMLHEEKGINWNDFPVECKRGTACIKSTIEYNLMDTMTQKEGMVKRTEWIIDKNMPIIKGEDRKYVERFIYVGEGMQYEEIFS